MKTPIILFCFLLCILQARSQMHAHNDYEKPQPFYNAYNHGAASIEVDIFLKDGKLLVAHDTTQLDKTRTIESVYLKPLDSIVNTGTVRKLQLLIDLKTEAYSTLDSLVNTLKQYPKIIHNKKLHSQSQATARNLQNLKTTRTIFYSMASSALPIQNAN